MHCSRRTRFIWFQAIVLAASLLGGSPAADAAELMPVFAQAGAALVEPGGLQALANQQRPAAVEAPAQQAEQPKAEAEPAAKAGAFEIRYLISYVLMLAFIGGGTALVIRPTGRVRQEGGKATSPAKAATPATSAGKK